MGAKMIKSKKFDLGFELELKIKSGRPRKSGGVKLVKK